MKQLRFFTMFFLIFAWGVVIATGPASASLYQDNFTATITKVTNGGGGFNPFGLVKSQEFSWNIVYDPAPINSGGSVVVFSGFYPTNQISVFIPRSGTTAQLFTKTDDELYSNDPLGNPYGVFTGGNLTELVYNFNQKPLSSPYTGAISIVYDAAEIWFESGTIGIYTKFNFDPGYDGFNPGTDRQVVPIPGALVLLSSGLAALAILRRRQG